MKGNIRWALAFIIPALFTVYLCYHIEDITQPVTTASLQGRIVRLQAKLDAEEERHDELRQALYMVEHRK